MPDNIGSQVPHGIFDCKPNASSAVNNIAAGDALAKLGLAPPTT
jgi:hypothetical protein